MWQKTVGSALLEVSYSGKLMVARVRLVVSVKELFTRTEFAKLLISLD